jgi:hypothetical protein
MHPPKGYTATRDSAVQAVRLFPRLAIANHNAMPKRNAHRFDVGQYSIANQSDATNAKSQVRAKLLRMILENERTRTRRMPGGNQPPGAKRPNAS